jgi:predicted nucleic acid-binding protein
MMVAAAGRGGCKRIVEEDLNAGRKVENPFRESSLDR